MSTFTLIKKGDTVFDKSQSITGTVLSINRTTSVAEVKIETGDENEIFLSKLANLIPVGKSQNSPLKIKVKYFNPKSTKLTKITKGDWIDLRSAETVEMKAGEFALIPLGVAMELPKDYEANIVPRSSTFKNFGIIQTNSFGVVDNSYSGNDDQWFFPAYALRDTTINFDERICQFRIQERMPEVELEEVEFLEGENRGGFGSTGVK